MSNSKSDQLRAVVIVRPHVWFVAALFLLACGDDGGVGGTGAANEGGTSSDGGGMDGGGGTGEGGSGGATGGGGASGEGGEGGGCLAAESVCQPEPDQDCADLCCSGQYITVGGPNGVQLICQ